MKRITSRMTKSKALKIAKRLFDARVQERYVKRSDQLGRAYRQLETYLSPLPHLCFNLGNVTMNIEWGFYWEKINKKHHTFMTLYFRHDYSTEEAILLRLVVLHQFINEHYK